MTRITRRCQPTTSRRNCHSPGTDPWMLVIGREFAPSRTYLHWTIAGSRRCDSRQSICRVSIFSSAWDRQVTTPHYTRREGDIGYFSCPFPPSPTASCSFIYSLAVPPLSDVLGPHGLPWEIPLYTIVRIPAYAAYRDKLLEEGLVDQTLVSSIAESPARLLRKASGKIYAFDDPIVVNVANKVLGHAQRFGIRALEVSWTSACISLPIRVSDQDFLTNLSKLGEMAFRFERSALEHENTRTLVMRFIKEVLGLFA
ncbi:hypothetical protein B0H34DRAFT_69803 [Crassisporium funariophilum]|nr:hypothetical protein B0H34DRAFT_69803 [Crassisporium funariophilum]